MTIKENGHVQECKNVLWLEEDQDNPCECPFCFGDKEGKEGKEGKESLFSISINYKDLVEEWLKEERIEYTEELLEDYTEKLIAETGVELESYFYHKVKDELNFELTNIYQLEEIEKTIKKAKCGYCSKVLVVDWDGYNFDHLECGDCTSKRKEAFVCKECAEKNDYTCPICKKKENLFPPHEMWIEHPDHWSDSVNEEKEEESKIEETTRGKKRREKRNTSSPSS